jgi:hypothetical protein
MLFYYFILFYVLLCVYVYNSLPPGVYPIAFDKYININLTINSSMAQIRFDMIFHFLPQQNNLY